MNRTAAILAEEYMRIVSYIYSPELKTPAARNFGETVDSVHGTVYHIMPSWVCTHRLSHVSDTVMADYRVTNSEILVYVNNRAYPVAFAIEDPSSITSSLQLIHEQVLWYLSVMEREQVCQVDVLMKNRGYFNERLKRVLNEHTA